MANTSSSTSKAFADAKKIAVKETLVVNSTKSRVTFTTNDKGNIVVKVKN